MLVLGRLRDACRVAQWEAPEVVDRRNTLYTLCVWCVVCVVVGGR